MRPSSIVMLAVALVLGGIGGLAVERSGCRRKSRKPQIAKSAHHKWIWARSSSPRNRCVSATGLPNAPCARSSGPPRQSPQGAFKNDQVIS